MKTLPQNELTLVSGGGGEPVYVDIGQFVGGYAKSIVQHWYLGPLAGTYAFFDSLAYAFEDQKLISKGRTGIAGVCGLFASSHPMKLRYKEIIIGVVIGWIGAMILTKYWIQIKDFLHSLF